MRSIFTVGLAVMVAGCATAPRRDQVEESDLSYLDSERAYADAPPAGAKAGATPRPVPQVEGDIARDELLEVLTAGPADVLGVFDVRPEVRLGKFHGWEIARQAEPGSRFAAVDLLPGDVVLAVNGRSIEKPQEFYAVWQELRVAPALVIAVERAGMRRELHFRIHDGAPPDPDAAPASSPTAPAVAVRPVPPPPPAKNVVKSRP